MNDTNVNIYGLQLDMVLYSQLSMGTWFRWGGALYIKTDANAALNVKTGGYATPMKSRHVVPLSNIQIYIGATPNGTTIDCEDE